jgi:SpoVK/Ycf46/Vps4 family AAA+-type ATPase
VGLEEVKNTLRRIASSSVGSIEKHQLPNKNSWLSILLYGPSGNGKSRLAAAMAKECGAKFISIESSVLLFGCTAWSNMSNTDKVKALFSEAEKNTPSAIFLDDVDIISQYTPNWQMLPFNQLLEEFDKPRNEVMIIASATKPEKIPKSLFQRFCYKIEVPLPDENDRREIFKNILTQFRDHAEKNNVAETTDRSTAIGVLAKATDGFSVGEIIAVWQKTLINSIPFEDIKPNQKIFLKPYNFKLALEEVELERKNKL